MLPKYFRSASPEINKPRVVQDRPFVMSFEAPVGRPAAGPNPRAPLGIENYMALSETARPTTADQMVSFRQGCMKSLSDNC